MQPSVAIVAAGDEVQFRVVPGVATELLMMHFQVRLCATPLTSQELRCSPCSRSNGDESARTVRISFIEGFEQNLRQQLSGFCPLEQTASFQAAFEVTASSAAVVISFSSSRCHGHSASERAHVAHEIPKCMIWNCSHCCLVQNLNIGSPWGRRLNHR